MTTLTLVAGAPPRDRLEWAAVAGLLGFVSALQLSIAAASICLAITLSCWAGALVLGQERWDAPRFFWPLLVYAAWTLVSAAPRPTRAPASSTPNNWSSSSSCLRCTSWPGATVR